MKNLMNYLKKGILIALLCLATSTRLTIMPISNPCCIYSNPTFPPYVEDPFADFDYT